MGTRPAEGPAMSESIPATTPELPTQEALDRPGCADGLGVPPANRSGQGRYDFLRPPQQPGEMGRLGPYRVLKVLGSGGMGIVFQAEDPGLRRPVALKVMKPSLSGDRTARQRFLHEAQAAAAIEHD